MFEFFSSLVDIIGTVVNAVLSTLQMLVQFITMVASGFTWLSYAIQFFPAFVKSFVFAFVSIAVIYQILNRE